MADNPEENIFFKKEFLSILNFSTKKYEKKIDDEDFIKSNKSYIEDENEDNKIKLNDCCDLNIYQIIQTKIINNENYYFLKNNIEINDIFKFDYNKIFYYLNYDNVQTIHESAIQIKKKINKMFKTIQKKYKEIKITFDFKNPALVLNLCDLVIYYDNYMEYQNKNKKKPYPPELRQRIENTENMLYKTYKKLSKNIDSNVVKDDLDTYKTKIEPSYLSKYQIYNNGYKGASKFDKCPVNIIKFSNLEISKYKKKKTTLKNNNNMDVTFDNDEYIIYNGRDYNFISDKEDDDKTLYGILNNLCVDKKDTFNINKITTVQNYDMLCFVYEQIKILYGLLDKYFDSSKEIYDEVIKFINESDKSGNPDVSVDVGSYEYPEDVMKINEIGGLNLFANSVKNLTKRFNEYVTPPKAAAQQQQAAAQQQQAPAQPQTLFRTGKEEIIFDDNNIHKGEINPNIKLYNKITNNNIDANLDDIILYQDFYFTLFFQDTITKPLNIEYIDPLGYNKINTDETYEVNDEFFYKKKHRVYLMSDFDNLKLFNKLKKKLLYLNFKIKAENYNIVLLDNEGNEIALEHKEIKDIENVFYFYCDNINTLLIDDENQSIDDKIYIFNETYNKLIQYHRDFYEGRYNYKNDQYKHYLNIYIENFLSIYNNIVFKDKDGNYKPENYETLTKIWKEIKTNQTTTTDIDKIISNFAGYKGANIEDKNMIIDSLKNLYNSGHDLLNYYYQTLYDEEKFNDDLNDMITGYNEECKQKTDEQILKYNITNEKKDQIITAYDTNLKINEIEDKNEFIQTVKTFIYILFDLLINRLFINQTFDYSDFINKVIDIYFSIFNLLFYKSDETKIAQYKSLLLICLTYYLDIEKEEDGNLTHQLINYNENKFKTLNELNENSNEIIENLINSFIFLLSDDYLNYVISDDSIQAIKIITGAYIYYYSTYEQNIIIDGQTIFINDSNKDLYYEYQKLISEREKLILNIKNLFKTLKDTNNEQKIQISEHIQINIKDYNMIINEITKKKEELLNPDIIKEKKIKKEKENNTIKKENKEFREEIKKKYIDPFINLIEQLLDNEKIVKDERIKKLLADKKKYFEDLKDNDDNSRIFKNSLVQFNNYKNLRVNQHLTNNEVVQYGINETLTDSLIELIKSQQIKKGDYFLISKNKKVKDAYIYLLNDYINNGENGFIVKINNIIGSIDLLNNLIEDTSKENQNMCEFVINNQNNVGALKIKLNELTNNGFKNNQLLGKYKLLQKQ